MRYSAFLAIFLLAAGCSGPNTYTLNSPMVQPVPRLDRAASAYVSIPREGAFGPTIYPGSAAAVAEIIREEFSNYLKEVTTSKELQSLEKAFESAKAVGSDYLIYSELVHWEDRATNWSTITDKIKVSIGIYRVSSRKLLDSVMIEGENSSWQFFNNPPQDILPDAIEEYAKKLFR